MSTRIPPLAALSLALTLSLSGCDWFAVDPSKVVRDINNSDCSASTLLDAQVLAAKQTLVVAFWHKAFGNQIPAGMERMDAFYGAAGKYAYTADLSDSSGTALRIDFIAGTGLDVMAGQSGTWEATTRSYLAAHPAVNVVMWSWENQLSLLSSGDVDAYLAAMGRLEADYPGVRFVYMTGNADGTGVEGAAYKLSKKIRLYCQANGKFLFDFNDIDSFDPAGASFVSYKVDKDCGYVKDSARGNWGVEWRAKNPGGWWEAACNTDNANANQKARAAWNLFINLAKDLAQ
jgi:hypothetical protein